VTRGAELVTGAGEALDQIKDAVASVVERVSDTSTAAGEQATGIRALTEATTAMDQTTQQTAQLAERSASGAADLRRRSDALLRKVTDITEGTGGETAADAGWARVAKG